MMKTLFRYSLALTLVYVSFQSNAQFSQAARDSINRLSYKHFIEMKEQIGISAENRPGPSGDPSSPNAANTDETKVQPYTLPDPLVFNSGNNVTSEKEWWNKRRGEIVTQFEEEMYGQVPENVPSVTWELVSVKDTTAGPYAVKEKTLRGVVDNSAYPNISVEIELLVGIPANATGPVPLVLEFGFIRWPFGPQAPEPSYFISPYEPRWKQQLASQGWGYAIIVTNSIQADNGAGLRSGIIGLTNKGTARTPDQWGALRAWAWGAGRAMDYFETDEDIDAERIGVEGTSRYGKAALVTMAFDQRFSLGFIGSSGAGGASILRRNFGESTENLASSGEYHWFCGNFIKYASSLEINDLPVDAHELIALCAPRPVLISAGSPFIEGQWIDAKGSFDAAVAAGPVYELLDQKPLPQTAYPPLGYPLISGDIAFRQHAGGHSTGPNWSTWIAWAHRYWSK